MTDAVAEPTVATSTAPRSLHAHAAHLHLDGAFGEANTALTQQNRDLSQQIAALTSEIHGNICAPGEQR